MTALEKKLRGELERIRKLADSDKDFRHAPSIAALFDEISGIATLACHVADLSAELERD